MALYAKASTAMGAFVKGDTPRSTALENSCTKGAKTADKTETWTKADGSAALTDIAVYTLKLTNDIASLE